MVVVNDFVNLLLLTMDHLNTFQYDIVTPNQ